MTRHQLLENVIRLFDRGLISPAMLWEALVQILPASELAESLAALDEYDQSVLREMYHERQNSLDSTVKSQEFLVQLNEWVRECP